MATITQIKEAIVALKDRTGSSIVAINKWLETEKKVSCFDGFPALFQLGELGPNFVFFAIFAGRPKLEYRITFHQVVRFLIQWYHQKTYAPHYKLCKNGMLALAVTVVMAGHIFLTPLREVT
jgi:hypothetical protein